MITYNTIGKTVCVHAMIATDIGAATVRIKGETIVDPVVRRMRADDGTEFLLIARVVRELPEVTRRASFDYKPIVKLERRKDAHN